MDLLDSLVHSHLQEVHTMTTQVGTGRSQGATGTEAAQQAIDDALDGVDRYDNEMAIVFASPAYAYDEVIDTIRDRTDQAALIGCSTAGEFTEEGPVEESVTVSFVSSSDMEFFVGAASGLRDDLESTVERAADSLPEKVDGYPYEMGINLHDGLTGRGEEIAMLSYHNHPMPYTGASAGDDLNLDETHVFANDDIHADGIALGKIVSKKPFTQAVVHGHQPISDRNLEVTDADGSVVSELDGRPAYEVWKDTIREPVNREYGLDIDDVDEEDDMFEKLLTRYEFGIRTGEDEYKVRWPGLTPNTDGPLHFATRIPEGMELYVMDSGKEEQINAARNVSLQALSEEPSPNFEPSGSIAFGCVCQAAILGEELSSMIDSMASELNVPLAGFETYGEVGMQPGDMRGYHNTTTSLLLFPR